MGKDFTKWPMPTLVIVKFVRHQREGDEPTSRGAIFRPVRTASNSPRRGLLPVPQAGGRARYRVDAKFPVRSIKPAFSMRSIAPRI